MKICVSAANGLEAAVKRELARLGVANAPAFNGRMCFDGDYKLLCDLNINLSVASRVYIVVKSFRCADFDSLFDAVKEVPWEDYFNYDDAVTIKPKLVQSKLSAFSATQSVAKKAIVERLLAAYRTDVLPETAHAYEVEVYIYHDYCMLLINSSGESLHKRGYRRVYSEAQIKENLAAAMLEYSVWNPSRPMCDLFTGTGTIAIEAALKEKNIAVGLNRTFDFLTFKNFDRRLYDLSKSEAIGRFSTETPQKIEAYDIDEAQLAIAHQHAEYAGVSDIIDFKHASMETFLSYSPRGVAFANPPYGARLEDRPAIVKLYRAYGKVRAANPDWSFYTITPVSDFERLFGAAADKRRKLYNGRIECTFYAHLGKKPVQ